MLNIRRDHIFTDCNQTGQTKKLPVSWPAKKY